MKFIYNSPLKYNKNLKIYNKNIFNKSNDLDYLNSYAQIVILSNYNNIAKVNYFINFNACSKTAAPSTLPYALMSIISIGFPVIAPETSFIMYLT